MSGTTLLAPAKLTTRLHVTGVRADGYHLLDAEMVTLDWADRLTITPAEVTTLEVSGPYAEGVPTDARNLIVRALDAVGRRARVQLDKQLPHGGGLGGGSADAAAVLRWAGIDDVDVATRLGADVPFCVRGGRARVRGIGEIIEPLPARALTVTLVIPPLQVSTPEVYAAWDRVGSPAGARNHLVAAAIEVCPQLAVWRDRIHEVWGVVPTLAGSGATWFVEGRYEDGEGALDGAKVVTTCAGGASGGASSCASSSASACDVS